MSKITTFEVRNPDGTIRLETISEIEAQRFASDVYKRTEVICELYEITRTPVDHTAAG